MATATSRPPGLRGYDARWSDATGTALVGPDGNAIAVANDITQTAENTTISFGSITPATAGFPSFGIEAASFSNSGTGAGTYNRGAFFGWNVGRHSGSTPVASKPAILMGFEDNYFDDGGDENFGTEWYIEHWAPDGLTSLRPFYTRNETVNGAQNATIFHEIGTGGDGSWQVRTTVGSPIIFLTEAAGVGIRNGLSVETGLLQATTIVGRAGENDNLSLTPGLATGSVVFQNHDFSANNLTIDNSGNLTTRDASTLNNFGATGMKIGGSGTQKFGFYGATPVIRPTGTPAAATDLATTQALANSLRASLLSLGLIAS